MSITITFDTLDDFEAFVLVVANNPGLSGKLDTLIGLITSVKQQESTVAADLSQLQTDVANNGTVIGSAETLLTQLSGMLATAIAALPDPTQLQQLQTDLETNTAGLAQAVAAGTPAAGATGATGP
jgi:hypothetical protein